MPVGTLEVFIDCARGLKDKDFLSRSDPYCIVTCDNDKQQTSVKSGGSPDWGETLTFKITSDDVREIQVKIYDQDPGRDDTLGEASIPLDGVYMDGSSPPTNYNVMKKGTFAGEIRVGFNFSPADDEY